MKKLKNTYYLLRHGRNIHQTELKDLCYGWPEDEVPCELDSEGVKQVALSGMKLMDKGIDLIYSSDILRTRQTAEIVSSMLQIERIVYDERLRDLNWGIYAGGPKKDALDFYTDKNRMNDRPLNGESWGDLKNRVEECLNDIESINEGKNILLVSHGDAILLLQAYVNDWDLEEIILQRENIIGTGELRKLN